MASSLLWKPTASSACVFASRTLHWPPLTRNEPSESARPTKSPLTSTLAYVASSSRKCSSLSQFPAAASASRRNITDAGSPNTLVPSRTVRLMAVRPLNRPMRLGKPRLLMIGRPSASMMSRRAATMSTPGSNAASCFSRHVGSRMSSPQTSLMYVPRASSVTRFQLRTAPPPASVRSRRTRGSDSKPRSISSVRSDEAWSATMSSNSLWVCSSTERMVSAMKSWLL